MSIMARYSGECPECGERWQPGDFIRVVPDDQRPSIWRHAVCPDASKPEIHPTCTDCWLAHPEGECDR